MAKIIFTVDNINYKGGGHFATFKNANYLCSRGHKVILYSPTKAENSTKSLLFPEITVTDKMHVSDADYIVVPFENSTFFEEIATLNVPRAKKIQWIHTNYDTWKNAAQDDVERRRKLLAFYDTIVFVSENARRSFLKHFPEYSDKCIVIHNFVDSDRIRAMAGEPVEEDYFIRRSDDQLNVVLVGRLEPEKAFHRMLDAARILKQDGLEINWLILGKGYEYDSLIHKKEQYGLDNVHFLGFRKNPYAYMRAADIVGALSEYEGFSLTIVESLLSGTPVISTRSGGATEMVENYGWVIPNDIFSIVRGMEEVYNSRQLLEEKRLALNTYTYDNTEIGQILDTLFQLPEESRCTAMNTKMTFVPQKEEKSAPEISVIIPVYNMLHYLAECLNSVVNQTFTDYEIIIVNDGSTDDSQSVIDDYVYRYPELIRAFTIKNRGLGGARNYGMEKAHGRYFVFVDSDDYIHKDALKHMYEAAKFHNADYVITDIISFWEDGKQVHSSSCDFPNINRFEIIKHAAKYGIVAACSKLIDRELFNVIQFPTGFYEDLATTPILLSYAKNIYYLPEGLYFYRQRVGSITSIKSGDKRLLDCYAAWDRIREHANPLFEKEIQFAVYWSLNFFCTNFLDDFTKQSKDYYDRNRDYFRGNAYIADAIREETFLDFEHLDTIPKIIHYCWFGNGEKSELIQKCMDSWKKYAPDFEIMEWNESNCDIHTNRYVEEAYEKKQYAFVSDYFRLKALYDHGGVYMDTDMELHQPLESFLYTKSFFAFETPLFIHAGILGAEKNCGLIGELRRSYEEDTFDLTECPGEDFTIPRRLTQLLIKRTNLQLNGKSQLLEGNIRVFSANRMTVNMHDGRCVCEHHYEGSWLRKDNGPAPDYTYEVLKHYFTWDLLHGDNDISLPGDTAQLLTYYKSECDRYENSTCWKITKPLRILGDFLKKIFRRNKVS